MLFRMDAREHQDLIHTISQAILDARYAPPQRRRSAWGEGYNEDLEQARRVAAAIVEALRRSGFQISRTPPAPHSQGQTKCPASLRRYWFLLDSPAGRRWTGFDCECAAGCGVRAATGETAPTSPEQVTIAARSLPASICVGARRLATGALICSGTASRASLGGSTARFAAGRSGPPSRGGRKALDALRGPCLRERPTGRPRHAHVPPLLCSYDTLVNFVAVGCPTMSEADYDRERAGEVMAVSSLMYYCPTLA